MTDDATRPPEGAQETPFDDAETQPRPVVHPRHLSGGQIIDDRYSVIEKVGMGGWGAVYRAVQHSTKREVALKILRTDIAQGEETRKRFVLEAQAISKLVHQNTVTLFDVGETADGTLYMAMEFLEGEPLNQVLRREGTLGWERALRIVRQVALSLDEAHGKGIVHRDIKPHNIMLLQRPGEPDFAKVLDFGVAKYLLQDQSLTTTGTTFGTPEYMSPEQIQSKAIDHRSDIYSLGIILYTLLAGGPPFTGDSPITIALAHVRQRLPRLPSSLKVPKKVLNLLHRMTAKNMEERPYAASDVAREIDDLLGTGTAPYPPAQVPVSRTGRRISLKKLWPLLMVLLGVGAVVFAGHRYLTREKAPAAEESVAAAEERVPKEKVEKQPERVPGAPTAPTEAEAPAEKKEEKTEAPAEKTEKKTDEPAAKKAPEPEKKVEKTEAPAEKTEKKTEKKAEIEPAKKVEKTEAPAELGVVVVESNVRRAKVLLPDEASCRTPCTLKRPVGTELRVRVVARDHRPRTHRLHFRELKQTVRIPLINIPLSEQDSIKSGRPDSETDGLK